MTFVYQSKAWNFSKINLKRTFFNCSSDTSASADHRHEWRYTKCFITLHYITLHVCSIGLDDRWFSLFAQFLFIKTQWHIIIIWRPHKNFKICLFSGSCRTFHSKQLSVMISAEICVYETRFNTDGNNNRINLWAHALSSWVTFKVVVSLLEVTLMCFTHNRSFNRLAHGGLIYIILAFSSDFSYFLSMVLCSHFET